MSSQHRRESFGPLNNAEGDIDTLTVLERAVVQVMAGSVDEITVLDCATIGS